jgi:putative oxidoreductase
LRGVRSGPRVEFRARCEGDAMSILQWLLQTDGSVVPLILRLILAVVMFPHGAQKTLGWFGGHGFKGTMRFFTSSGTPAILALLAIAAEFLGPLGLAVGLLTRVAALGIACVMLVAIFTVHWPHGFFMNWYGNQKGEGFEYHLLVLGIAITLIIVGAGAWSLDGVLADPR